MEQTVRMSVSVSKDTHKKLKILAAERETNIQAIVHKWIEEGLQRPQYPEEAPGN
jgi:hypothetical protein